MQYYQISPLNLNHIRSKSGLLRTEQVVLTYCISVCCCTWFDSCLGCVFI